MSVCVVDYGMDVRCVCVFCFFFQAEDGIRDLVRSRGLGDVYKRQTLELAAGEEAVIEPGQPPRVSATLPLTGLVQWCLSLIHI